MEKGSGDMAVPKLFCFPNLGSGQLKYLRSMVRPRNQMQGSCIDDIRDSAAFAVLPLGWEMLKELQLKVITSFVASQDFFCGPSNLLWEKLMLCMSTTTLQSGRLTKINSDCCNAITAIMEDQVSEVYFPCSMLLK